MKINDLPSDQRPRERLLKLGSECLSDSELLGVLFGSGMAGKSSVELGGELLWQFGGLRRVFNAGSNELRGVAGIGAAKVSQLKACMELCRRCLREELLKDGPLTSPNGAKNYLIAKLRDREREVFACLFLDTRHQVIGYEELFQGTVDGASVYPRIVVQRALVVNAAAVICCHNHPSGVAEPSRADESLTRRLQSALELVDIRLLDHFIVGDGRTISLAERGIV